MTTSLNKDEIIKLLPHRDPMLLIDELINSNVQMGVTINYWMDRESWVKN